MIMRFISCVALGAFVIVMLLAAMESQASVPKGGKFEGRAQPASCWIFCAPKK
jgi:hypothetical protein